MLICPVCGKALKKTEKKYECENNHTFDIAKQGYSNLLLSNQKNSKIPGDSKEMVLSRKNFLEQGNYQKISDKVNEVLENLCKTSSINILDIGCGEGYYTANLKRYLNEKGIENNIFGIDISKEAIIAAAKSYKGIDWFVASAVSLPFSDNSLDFIVCMFAKIDPKEFYRVLKKNGKLVIVSTGKNHLEDLKAVVYEEVKKEFYLPEEDESLKIFKHVDNTSLNYKTTIFGNETIKNLFNMTPYRWRSPKIGIERLFSLEKLTTTVEVTIDVFEK